MAVSFRFDSIADVFGAGASVSAYHPSGLPVPSSPARGVALATSLVLADGSLTFTGLVGDTPYVALGAGAAYRSFRTEPEPTAAGVVVGGTGLEPTPLVAPADYTFTLDDFQTHRQISSRSGGVQLATLRAGLGVSAGDWLEISMWGAGTWEVVPDPGVVLKPLDTRFLSADTGFILSSRDGADEYEIKRGPAGGGSVTYSETDPPSTLPAGSTWIKVLSLTAAQQVEVQRWVAPSA